MSPTVLALHFACLQQTYNDYEIFSPEQIFNLYESGVFIRPNARGKAKAAMISIARQISIILELSLNEDHVTVIPVVSACGASGTLFHSSRGILELRDKIGWTVRAPLLFSAIKIPRFIQDSNECDITIFHLSDLWSDSSSKRPICALSMET